MRLWPFGRRRPDPDGTLRLGEHSEDPGDYTVLTVSESRFPGAFTALWGHASHSERDAGVVRRWAVLVPVVDPRVGRVADLGVEIEGNRACYLRPPHLDRLATRIESANVLTLEVPALIEWGPAGPTVRLLIVDDADGRPSPEPARPDPPEES